MRKQSIRLLALMLLFLCGQAFGQNKLSIDKVYKVTLRNSGTIVQDEQIKGYFFFYMSDKVDRKTNEYTLQIVDENLNKIKDFKFTDSKNIQLLESSYNGDALSFLFYNDDENSLDYRLYDMGGKPSFVYSKALDKKSERYFKSLLAMNESEESENQNVFDIAGKGFLSVIPLRDGKKYTYDINFYASGKRRTWIYTPTDDDKVSAAHYLGANDSVALFEVASREKIMSKESETSILGISLETGRKAFEVRNQDGKNQLLPMNATTLGNTGKFLMTGPYYASDDRLTKDNSEGLGIWLMNSQGKVERSKYVSWINDMGKFLPIDAKGRVGDMGYVYVHRLVQTDDGNIFAICEGYKKVADGVGIALNVLSGGYNAGVTKLRITDLMMVQLDKDFKLMGAKIYEKNSNNFSLNTGSDFLTPHTLAIVAKAYGAFDYDYTQMGKDHTSFVSTYTDYEKGNGYKGLTFHTVSYYNGKITTDKINLKTDASKLRVLPAKPGSVLLMEYFKKDKRLDLRMEKVN